MGKYSNRKHKQRRNALVDKLEKRGIEDQSVLAAIREIPRHEFVDTALEDRAYEDSEEDVKSAILTARNYLKQFLA